MKTSLLNLCAALAVTVAAAANAAEPGRISLDEQSSLGRLVEHVDGSVTFKENLTLERMEVPVPYLARDQWGGVRGTGTKKEEMPALKVELPAAKDAKTGTNCFLAMESESDKINLTANGAAARLSSDIGNAPASEASYFHFRYLRVKMHFADRDRQALITCDGVLSLRSLQEAFAEHGMQITWSKLPAKEEKYVERIEVQDLNEVDAK